MKIIFTLLLLVSTVSFADDVEKREWISHKQLAWMCANGAPEGLQSIWVQSASFQILSSISSLSTKEIVLDECSRKNKIDQPKVTNSGSFCRFKYDADEINQELHILFPETLKSNLISLENVNVIVFEKEYQPSLAFSDKSGAATHFQYITAACKRVDNVGFYVLGDNKLLMEINQ